MTTYVATTKHAQCPSGNGIWRNLLHIELPNPRHLPDPANWYRQCDGCGATVEAEASETAA